MPFYDYRCDKCDGKVFEVFQSMSETHMANCPDCGKRAKRLYNPTPFKFDFKAGWDAGLGTYVDTKKQRANLMSEKGLRRAD